jgi:hypothetical protein
MSSKDKIPLTLMKLETELRADFAPTAKLQKDRLSTDNPFSTFEARTALHQHRFDRITVNFMNSSLSYCSIRQCHRKRRCSGPLLATDRQEQRVKVQQILGLQGLAYRYVPHCMALCSPAIFKDFLASRTVLHDIFSSDPRFEQRCRDIEIRKGADRAPR